MPQIAVDVVLIPPEDITDIAIEANRQLLKQVPDKIILDRGNCLPHISLAMGCIERKSMADIEVILKDIAQRHSPGPLHITGVHIQKNSSGENVALLKIENTRPLQLLHEHVMWKLAKSFSYDVRADMVLCDGRVSESTLLWIRNYPEKASFENFFPHITLGYGETEIASIPAEFSVSKLALCHLGNHCTCRKVLITAELIN